MKMMGRKDSESAICRLPVECSVLRYRITIKVVTILESGVEIDTSHFTRRELQEPLSVHTPYPTIEANLSFVGLTKLRTVPGRII